VFSVLPGVNQDWHQVPIVTNKMSYHLRPESRPEPALSLLRRYFTVVQKDPDPYGEIIPRGYSKAPGMIFLLEHLGFSQEQTFAFGDSLNDLEMLTFAANGIAMGSSRRTVLRASDHVTGSAAENGIADGLAHFGLI
jgi:hydroxymethylpyrimidine pyrophosphatase-like HAD family hydrolase